MHKMDLILNSQQKLIYHKIKPKPNSNGESVDSFSAFISIIHFSWQVI